MFIISTDQLKLCEAIRRSHSQAEHLFVYAYKEWLFVKGEVYSYQEKYSAIAQIQRNLESAIMCILVVDEQDNYIISYHDSELELLSEDIPPNLEEIINAIRHQSGLIKTNHYKLRAYPRSIVGNELVDWLCDYFHCSREQAVEMGQSLIDNGWLHHTWDDHNFKDEPLLYRFYQDETITPPLIAK